MRPIRPLRTLAAALAATLALAACGSDYPLGDAQRDAAENSTSMLSGVLSGAGSSAQGPAMDAWIAGFGTLHPNVQLQYSPDGSGAGRSALLAGAVDFAGSDAYLQEEELVDARAVCGPEGALDIPAYISPIAVAFNLPGIQSLNLDAAAIAKIFRGEITQWNDPVIAALNPDVDLPSTRITPVSRADDSGTTENFTEYLHEVAPDAWPDAPSGTWPGGLQGENAQGSSGVVSTVTRTEGALTYADDSVIDESMGTANLLVGEDFVPISADAASTAVEQSTRVPGRSEHDIALQLDRRTTAAGAYPLVLVSYQIYCSSYDDAGLVERVQAFGKYVVSEEGQQASADAAKSAPIPKSLAEEARAAMESITVRK
ncbi:MULTISPECIES: phosphate ABC transporter substrate-binding protein PstS [unclassified Arthrobacter]|uniref:phosphate ABC transporter substrate-binding protein PstS n=1 Tax=unclassified Arthrobacter TaxID=235627 RepID=UPI001D137657|nr:MULTISPECIES: phosphate ABC transporter substrate-binding protein PstS [unclassified Arthrobacter]MCC3275522.1 phosphate ABC transporter substrate-binding protein PstS [Arthrobacter sp. zg-Y20]MCC3278596.1 phosphate ABC transporter substrate-binding protein PstS [Arthrobacter sp. zg-Y40]MCC9176963.1 phosphate ABC transporter substrate-binding protein PstS [Arthrobacter sp. zg-Y750]MDK1315679.1 phosphate ABC transporter substrate-binding protein PstS [Arthrobacter sp. zg.Y20]MDK1326325.1 pho